MRVVVMIKATKSSEAGEMPSEELLTAMGNFNEELVNAGIMLAGEGLKPTSAGKRIRFSGANRTVVDGPFAETKEQVAGFWVWKVESMEEAVEWVKRCPCPMLEDSDVDIRPVFEAEDFGEEFSPELREQESSVLARTLGLEAPRFEDVEAFTIGGLNATYTYAERGKIPSQWQTFAPSIGKIPGQVGGMTAYGVMWNPNPGCGFDYLAGVAVSDPSKLPQEFTAAPIPAGRFIVFPYSGHVSKLGELLDTIWQKWVPIAAVEIAQSPSFEKYSEEYNPQSGMGGMEIWLPLQA